MKADSLAADYYYLEGIILQSIFMMIEPARRNVFVPIKRGMRLGCFHILTEDGVAAMFLRTARADVEQARVFVSKNSNLDLEAVRDILQQCPEAMISLKKADFLGRKKVTRSVMLQNCILHLHMVEEPDQFGSWKIYGVDKEMR